MGRASRAAALVLITGLLSGCGTVANLSTGAREGWKNVQIYGGVRRDVQSAGDWFTHSWVAPEKLEFMQDIGAIVGVGLVGIDMPLSAVGDTLTLPVTIPASIWGRSRNDADVPRQTAPPPPAVRTPPPPVSAPP
jgi:uncharacterized protein YceK